MLALMLINTVLWYSGGGLIAVFTGADITVSPCVHLFSSVQKCVISVEVISVTCKVCCPVCANYLEIGQNCVVSI